MSERHRVMTADHDENDRQRQVVVVDRALLGLPAQKGIGFLTGETCRNQLRLGRNDAHEDVDDHDDADQRTNMHVGRAAREDLSEGDGDGCEHDDGKHIGRKGVLGADSRCEEGVIGEPADHQGGDPDSHRLQAAERSGTRLYKVGFGAEVVDDGEQHDAGDSGESRLPLEPVQGARNGGWRHEILVDLVETTAVHHPQLAFDTLLAGFRLLEMSIEPHEEEGRADPGDADDDMSPADDEIGPVENGGFHGAYSPTLCAIRRLTMRPTLASASALSVCGSLPSRRWKASMMLSSV